MNHDFDTATALGTATRRAPAVAILIFALTATWTLTGSVRAASSDLAEQADRLFQEKSWEGAVAAYRQITEAQPEDGEAWFRLGHSLNFLGEPAAAIPAYEKAIERGFSNPWVTMGLALAHNATGDADQALANIEAALGQSLAPDMLASIPNLDGLREDPRYQALVEKTLQATWPCEHREGYGGLDFWIGEWDVYSQGMPIAVDRITRQERGCLLLESWESVDGTTAHSAHFFNEGQGQWYQTWIGSRGFVTRYAGQVEDGVLEMEGTTLSPDGTEVLARMRLERGEGDRLLQSFATSNDEGKTWTPGVQLTFVRRRPAPTPAP